MLNFTEELHTRPYMVTKRRCVWNKTFPLSHLILHFTTFIMFLYIHEMTTKAHNVTQISHYFQYKLVLSCKSKLKVPKFEFNLCCGN